MLIIFTEPFLCFSVFDFSFQVFFLKVLKCFCLLTKKRYIYWPKNIFFLYSLVNFSHLGFKLENGKISGSITVWNPSHGIFIVPSSRRRWPSHSSSLINRRLRNLCQMGGNQISVGLLITDKWVVRRDSWSRSIGLESIATRLQMSVLGLLNSCTKGRPPATLALKDEESWHRWKGIVHSSSLPSSHFSNSNRGNKVRTMAFECHFSFGCAWRIALVLDNCIKIHYICNFFSFSC